MDRAQIDVQRESEGVLTDRFGAEMHLHERGVVVDLFHEGIVPIPEPPALSVGVDDGDMFVAEACKIDH